MAAKFDKTGTQPGKTQTGQKRPRSKSANKSADKKSSDKISIAYAHDSHSRVFDALKFDASNVYFNNLLGTDLATQAGQNRTRLPGILVFGSQLNVQSRSDMINVAATSIYTYVRHANSGKTNYESSDLMVYLLAISEIYVGLAELMRAYGIASYFRSENLYSGAILTALGFNPTTLRTNLADVRYAINVLINKAKAFAVPRVFHFFDERISEFSTVYKDEPTERAQFIAIRPSTLGRFDPTAEGGGAITFIRNDEDLRDIYEQIARVDDLIQVLRQDEDSNIISGDMLKAYGDNLFQLSPIEPDFVIEPVYDELFLLQIQNAHVVHEYYPHSIMQENNRLSQKIQVQDVEVASYFLGSRLLNSTIESIDANLIFALSKYQLTFKVDKDDYFLDSGNTTLLQKAQIWCFETSDDNLVLMPNTIHQVTPSLSTTAVVYLTKFKHHLYLYATPVALPVGDMHYVAKLSKEDTARMNDARFILSFQTRQMG